MTYVSKVRPPTAKVRPQSVLAYQACLSEPNFVSKSMRKQRARPTVEGGPEPEPKVQVFEAGRTFVEASSVGRPTYYTDELADEMCLRMATGASLITISLQDGMPGLRTILEWLMKDDEFRTKVARARELRADIHAEEILTISDNAGGNEFLLDGKMRRVIIERANLMVNTRLRLMALMNPMKYGPRAAITVTGNMSLEQMITATLDAPRPPPPQMIEGRAEEQPTRVDNEGEEERTAEDGENF